MVLPGRREVKVLNQVGVRIFALLDGTHTEDDIVRTVCEEYDVTEGQATEDVRGFLDDLRRNGMLAENEPEPREALS